MQFVTGLGRFGLFAGAVLARTATPPLAVGDIARHTWTVSARSLGPVLAVVFPLGMVMALQGLSIFALFGAERLLSSMVSVAVLRELSPVLASTLIASQGGSTIAAELGAMRIQEEIDATEVMAVDPIRIHVVPRFLAVVLATPVLGIFGSLGGIAGGYTTAVLLKGQAHGVYMDHLWLLAEPGDLAGGVLKCLLFGTMIGLASCYQGFHASGGAAGVGRAVNNTVVVCITALIAMNYFLTSALFGVSG